jgi:RNA polymerase sigma factor (sigma-70 family)
MEELVQKAIDGDKKAEKEIFDYLFVRFKYLAKRTVGESDCEDLAQEACMTILEKYKNEEFTVSFTAWAYGVLKMKIGNYLQSGRRRFDKEAYPVNDIEVTASTQDPTLKKILIDCLRKISRSYIRYARALNLAYQGYDTEEACSKLDMNPNHYYVTLNRGRSLLKSCIEEGGISL